MSFDTCIAELQVAMMEYYLHSALTDLVQMPLVKAD